jgi:hypothetical protein
LTQIHGAAAQPTILSNKTGAYGRKYRADAKGWRSDAAGGDAAPRNLSGIATQRRKAAGIPR